jgi:23S rRNA (guanosine2251-2'-O)-methyltransferase
MNKHKSRQSTDAKQPIRADLYGRHACEAALLNPQRAVEAIYIAQENAKRYDTLLHDVHHQRLNRPSPTYVPRAALDKKLKNAVHQDIALAVQPLDEVNAGDFIARSAQQLRTRLIMLDQVTDPHNVGAILRSAAAFGVDGVIMQKKHSPNPGGALAKVASGAVEHVPVAYEINLSRALADLQDSGFTALGLDEAGMALNTVAIPDKLVLVLGAEGKGLRANLKHTCDQLVRLPTESAMPSLNVSNAAAVALYASLSRA